MTDPRVVKPKLPVKTIVGAVAIGVLVLCFIVYAVWQSGVGIVGARMTGTVVAKDFKPQPEDQIVLNKSGDLTPRHVDGEYTLTVEVPQVDGTKKKYTVWLNKSSYDAVKIGDSYDVGPMLIKE